MNKIATVQKVTHTGSNNGFNFWEVELTGGDKGGISGKKPECYVKEGDLVEYSMDKYSNGNPKINVINKNTYVKGSESAPAQNGQPAGHTPDVQTYIIRQSSLQRALEFYAQNEAKPDLHGVCAMAEAMKDYVLNGTIPAKKVETPTVPY